MNENTQEEGLPIEDQPVQQKNWIMRSRDAIEKRSDPIARAILPHPNFITGRIRPLLAAGAIVTHNINSIVGTTLYSLNLFGDWLDGMSARANNQRTKEGEKLDPLVDKITNISALIYLMIQHIEVLTFDAAAIANITVDIWSQLQRGPLWPQIKEGMNATLHPELCTHIDPVEQNINNIRANTWGKAKMGIASVGICVMMGAGDDQIAQNIATGMLYVSAVLGTIGTLKRKGIDVIAKAKTLLSKIPGIGKKKE